MGCTNSKERPRTPPPDAALQNVVSDGDGFWAANGETRASREAMLPGSKRDMTPGSRGAEVVGDAWRAQQLAVYGPAAKPTATAEVSAPATAETAAAPKPSPTKKPSIKPVMPGGRKKTNKKKKKGNKKK